MLLTVVVTTPFVVVVTPMLGTGVPSGINCVTLGTVMYRFTKRKSKVL